MPLSIMTLHYIHSYIRSYTRTQTTYYTHTYTRPETGALLETFQNQFGVSSTYVPQSIQFMIRISHQGVFDF